MPDATAAEGQGRAGVDPPHSLLPEDLLDLTDLFLQFAGCLFVFSLRFQLGIHAEFSGDLLQLTLYFVKRAFRLVLRAGFHGIPPVCPLIPLLSRCPVGPSNIPRYRVSLSRYPAATPAQAGLLPWGERADLSLS